MDANDTDTEPDPPAAGDEHALRRGDEVEATGWAAEIERLAGRSWMALSAGQVALRGAAHYLDPADVQERARRLAEERAETIAPAARPGG